MPYVRTVPVDVAEGLAREQYDSELAEDGYVSNMTQLFSLRPKVYEAWGQLRDSIRDRHQLEAIMRDFRDADLDEADVAIMAFAEKVALHAYRVTPEEVEALRDHGLTDAEVFDVVPFPETAAATSSAGKA